MQTIWYHGTQAHYDEEAEMNILKKVMENQKKQFISENYYNFKKPMRQIRLNCRCEIADASYFGCEQDTVDSGIVKFICETEEELKIAEKMYSEFEMKKDTDGFYR